MSDSKFKVWKAHKMADWLEAECTEWATNLVTEHFGVDEVSELSLEQMHEVFDQFEELDNNYGDAISIGFLNVIRNWEYDNEREGELL
jgi:hypothetical protein